MARLHDLAHAVEETRKTPPPHTPTPAPPAGPQPYRRVDWPALRKALLIPAAICIPLAVLYIVFVVHPQSQRRRPPAGDLPQLSAFAVAEDYARNEIDADRFYRGRWFRVSAIVLSIRQDATRSPYLEVGGPLTAWFVPAARQGLAALRPRQHIRFVGRCAGVSDRSVHFYDCQLVPPPAPRANDVRATPSPPPQTTPKPPPVYPFESAL